MLRLPRSNRLPAAALASAAALTLLAAPPALADDEQPESAETKELTKGEERLARLLEGRVAGEPQECIRNFPTQRVRVIEKTAYVYGRGKTIYVQRTRDPANIDRDDILVSRNFQATRLCRLDQATTVDRFVGFFTGNVFYEEFVPYTRVEAGDSSGQADG
ncbi:MAG: hypothetical protein AAF250_11475 [Pseudomonadota bacterium]